VASDPQTLELADKGIAACRQGRWDEGLGHLAQVTQGASVPSDLPAAFYSYLGLAMAKLQGRRKEGLALCQHAIKLEFFRGEHYFNLAQIHLLVDNRAGAIKAVQKGLAQDRKNRALQNLLLELGRRQRPVLPFLARSNPLNVALGKLRHRLTVGK
jgi:tetratricopeptide (TPR) repeat protein